MRKFITLFFIFVLMMFIIALKATAADCFNITSANFDTSSSIMALSSSNFQTTPNISDIKVVKLSNPTRIYFDLPDTVLSAGKKDWIFNTDGIKEVKISQFSSNPNIVRVVITYDDNFDISNMKIVSIGNGLYIKFRETIAQNPYMQNTYRDDHSSSNDFYEYMTVSSATNPNDAIAKIDSAFTGKVIDSYGEDLRLNTKYYIDKLVPGSGMITVSGFGSVSIEKPMILTNPLRIAFDMPNTLVNKSIRNREYNIGGSDKVRIGQFSVNKARIVITTQDVTKYIPVYARDNQSLVLINTDYIKNLGISGEKVLSTGFLYTKIDELSSAMTLNFDKAVVHGFDRTNSEVIVYLYNVNNYDNVLFDKTFIGTPFAQSTMEKTSKGIKLTIPIEHDSLVTTYLGMDGKSLKIQIRAPRNVIKDVIDNPIIPDVKPLNMPQGTDGKHKIVIDAGHGGTDAGAIRNGLYEKYITLDVAKRVEKMLKAQGYGVLMTRSDDSYVSLQDRVAFSEAYVPEAFVSIHVNSSTSEAPNGIETHYYHQESIPLAQSVHSSLVSSISANDRGTFKSKFYVINHTTAPAILVEMGFISNTAERIQLVTDARKQATAKAIVEGINNYFKSK